MAKTKETIVIEADDKTARAFRSILKNANQLDKEGRQISRTFTGLGPVITGVFTGVAVRGITRTVVEFEKLEASLRTVEGSADKANQTFEFLKDFASQTPFQVEELTQSYIKLKALGLDPTESSLRSFGNTASAMGKTLDQFVEAVADAVTGEFERLKEFGIKARSEGDNVAFTFQGVTTTIGKNAAEIEDYLRQIGEVQFAGAMQEQMNTLGGAFSNLQDSVSLLSEAIGEAGFSTVLKSASLLVSDFTREVTFMIEQLGDGASAVDVLSGAFSRLFLGDETKQLARELEREAQLVEKINNLRKNLEEGGAKNGGLAGERGLATRNARGQQQILEGMEKELDLTRAKIQGLQNIVVEQAEEHNQTQQRIADQAEEEEAQRVLNKVNQQAVEIAKKKKEATKEDTFDPAGDFALAREAAAWERWNAQWDEMEKPAKEALEDIADEGGRSAELLVGQFDNAFRSMEDTIVGFVTSGKLSFNSLITSMLDGLARLAARELLLAPLQAAVGSYFGGGGLSFVDKSTIPGRRASGGAVSAGAPYMVGEAGPELFVPSGNGDIVPNSAMGGMSVQVNVGGIDARGADPGGIQQLTHYLHAEFAPRIVALATRQAKKDTLMTLRRPGHA